MSATFLTAEWCYLVMVNYVIDGDLLGPHVPAGTQLDRRTGKSYLSLIGFHFRDTRILGVPVPFHQEFEEVNLRFYVRREVGGEIRHGVTFIKEMVPLPAVSIVAKLSYNEPYETRQMRHRIDSPGGDGAPVVDYSWSQRREWGRLSATATGDLEYPASESLEEFVVERPWGYTRQRDGTTIEYHVQHPRWRIWHTATYVVEGDFTDLYGDAFAKVLEGRPASVFIADGSAVRVTTPEKLR